MNVSRNVGRNDRLFRAAVGALLVVLALATLGAASGHLAGIVALLAGVVLLATAAAGFCPAYLPFRFTTCRM